MHNPFGYTGEYTDSETGFVYLRNRYYDPSIGRFISEDPIRDGLNWYMYCGGNPVMFVDPLGLKDVGLRAVVESLGGTVTPNKKKLLWFSYGLKSITVKLNNITKTYTSSDYRISKTKDEIEKFGKDRAIIDDKILFEDFATLSPSKEVEEFIKDYEKCILTSYDANPGKGDWTIGWGHKIGSGGNNPNVRWTQKQANEQFSMDLDMMASATFNTFLKNNNIILSQNQYDAMLSWTFNYGQNIWDEKLVGDYGETMRNFLIKGDYSVTATQDAFAVYSKTNTIRRNQEMNMFLNGDYSSTH